MQESGGKGQRLIALFVLGCLLFNYPVLSLFNLPAEAFGVPVDPDTRAAHEQPRLPMHHIDGSRGWNDHAPGCELPCRKLSLRRFPGTPTDR